MNTCKQKAMDLSVEVYRLVKNFPPEEVLTEILMRSTADIAIKISQSKSAETEDERIELLASARGKISAVETQLLICVGLKLLEETQIEPALNLCSELREMLRLNERGTE